MSLKDLVKIVAPPAAPEEVGSAKDWEAAEKALKIKLPHDYYEFCEKYGSGSFASGKDATFFYNPFSKAYKGQLDGQLAAIRAYKDGEEDDFPYEIYPKKSGLLPLGRNDNGYIIFYLTEGNPEEWPIIVQGPNDFHRYEMAITNLMVTLFAGKSVIPPWPKGWFAKAKVAFKPRAFQVQVQYTSIFQIFVERGFKADFWVQSDALKSQQMCIHVKSVQMLTGLPILDAKIDPTAATGTVDIYKESRAEETNVDFAEKLWKKHYFEIASPK